MFKIVNISLASKADIAFHGLCTAIFKKKARMYAMLQFGKKSLANAETLQAWEDLIHLCMCEDKARMEGRK